MTDKKLTSIVERIEALEKDRTQINEDIAEIYQEADDKGYNRKALRAALKWRRDPDAMKGLEEQRDEYLASVGFDTTPLGQHAAEKETRARKTEAAH